jgi:hypothetical protein
MGLSKSRFIDFPLSIPKSSKFFFLLNSILLVETPQKAFDELKIKLLLKDKKLKRGETLSALVTPTEA